MKYSFLAGDTPFEIELDKKTDSYHAVVEGQVYEIHLIRADSSEIVFRIGGRTDDCYWAKDGTRRWIWVRGKAFQLTLPNQARERNSFKQARTGEKVILSPMPGYVRAVQVAAGDEVAQGQTMLVLEAMKMEIRVQAPHAGRVARIMVDEGQSVEREQELAEIE